MNCSGEIQVCEAAISSLIQRTGQATNSLQLYSLKKWSFKKRHETSAGSYGTLSEPTDHLTRALASPSLIPAIKALQIQRERELQKEKLGESMY